MTKRKQSRRVKRVKSAKRIRKTKTIKNHKSLGKLDISKAHIANMSLAQAMGLARY